ncbi:MAG TPA: hypothetical protein VKE74_24545 [Gemmataceae bacterium]|nr:hypothetical protein [Gemmataceae bacterium]
MRKWKLVIATLAVVACVGATASVYAWRTRGTHGSPDVPPPDGRAAAKLPTSPQEALVECIQAMSRGDDARFFAVVETDHGLQRDYLRTLLEFIREATRFQDEFIRVYGRDAWVAFQDLRQKPDDGDAHLSILPWLENKLAWAPTAPIQQEGSEVYCVVAGEDAAPCRWIFMQSGGGWRLDGRSLCPAQNEIEKSTATLRSCAEDVRRFAKVIGYPGLRPEDIDVELGRAMVQSIHGIKLPPKRFDIEKLMPVEKGK